MIDHEYDGLGHSGDGSDEPNDIGDTDSQGRYRAENARLDALDPIERHREVGEEDGGVVVTVVGRHPRDAVRLQTGELREQGRLAVAGWRHHGDQRNRIGPRQGIQQSVSRDHARPRRGHEQLGLVQIEADRKRASSANPPGLIAGLWAHRSNLPLTPGSPRMDDEEEGRPSDTP